MNIANLIDISNDMMTVKDILKAVNYNVNDIYIDKFWDSIQNDKWIYISNNMLIWMGYSNNEIKKGKLSYSKLLESNFDENKDYKMVHTKEFKENAKSLNQDLENIDTHNKTKHLVVSPDCFKQSLMLLRTDESKIIRCYYLELEKGLCKLINQLKPKEINTHYVVSLGNVKGEIDLLVDDTIFEFKTNQNEIATMSNLTQTLVYGYLLTKKNKPVKT
jgi:phage anti-repressor protein